MNMIGTSKTNTVSSSINTFLVFKMCFTAFPAIFAVGTATHGIWEDLTYLLHSIIEFYQ